MAKRSRGIVGISIEANTRANFEEIHEEVSVLKAKSKQQQARIEELEAKLLTQTTDVILASEQTRLNNEVKRLNHIRLIQRDLIKKLEAALNKELKDGA